MKITQKIILNVIAITAIIIVVVPIAINEAYKLNRGYFTLYTASDLIAYFGAILSFLGTVSLGLLALWQNNKIQENSDKYQDMLLKMEMQKNQPKINCYYVSSRGGNSNLRLKSKNYSENLATNIKVENFQVSDSKGKLKVTSKSVKLSQNGLGTGGEIILDFINEPFPKEEVRLSFHLNYTDTFDKEQRCIVSGMVPEVDVIFVMQVVLVDSN